MMPADELVGNDKHDNSKYCLAKPGEIYLVYLPNGGSTELDLSAADGSFSIEWMSPQNGQFQSPSSTIAGGSKVTVDSGNSDGEDRLALIRKINK